MGSEDEHPDNVKESGEGFLDLKDRPRSCTDCLCVALLVACWAAMTVVGFAAIGLIKYEYINPGVPARLTHAVDYAGRVCGYDRYASHLIV